MTHERVGKDAIFQPNSCFPGKIQEVCLGLSFTRYVPLFISVSTFALTNCPTRVR